MSGVYANLIVDYQLQTLNHGRWLIVQTTADEDEISAAAAQLAQTQEFEAVRVMRRLHDEEYDYTFGRLVASWFRPGVREPEPWTPVVAPGEMPAACETHEDLVRDEARAFLHPFLVGYLEENRVCLMEVLHHERAADLFMGAGTVYQTLLQRVSVVQAQGTSKGAPNRLKELEAIVAARLKKLKADGQLHTPVPLRPGKFSEGLSQIEEKFPDPKEAEFQQLRALAHYLSAGRGWADKLEMLFQLYEPHLDSRHAILVDRIGQDLLLQPGTTREILANAGRRRIDRMIGLVDMLNAKFGGKPDELPLGLRAFAKLILEEGMPRCREAIRERLLREISVKQNLTNEASLAEEMRALQQLFVHTEKERPRLAQELEFIHAVQERVDRMLHPDVINDYITGVKGLRDKIDRLLTLAEASPVDLGKERVAAPIRNVLGTDDVVREFVTPLKDRTGAVPALAALAQRFVSAKFEAKTEAEFVGVFDHILLDILRNDVLKSRGTALERMQRIVRLCTNPPLPPGRARRFASEAIRAALGSPDLAKTYAERFPNEKDRIEALSKLRDLLRAAGLLTPG